MQAHTERVPSEELGLRHFRLREQLARLNPEVGGVLIFSKQALYYASGSCAPAAVFVPRQGPVVALCRKGFARARLESALPHVLGYRSYGDWPDLLKECGLSLEGPIGLETHGLSFGLGQLLASKLPGVRFESADAAILKARAVKTAFELDKMRQAGQRHAWMFRRELPTRIRPGMTEEEVAHLTWEIGFSLGHCGILRMQNPGEELFFGCVAAGDSSNYPTAFNGALGLRGAHPASPYMGSSGKTWLPGEVLNVDTGFCLEGYNTDKTQSYFAGEPGDAPKDVLAAHACCVDITRALSARMVPGAKPSDLYALANDMAAEAGFLEGLNGLGESKVPFIGHGIGLCIDEYPAIAKGFDEPLEEGMVLALEPKIGLPGLGMVGIENTFEVRPGGAVNLTLADDEDDIDLLFVSGKA